MEGYTSFLMLYDGGSEKAELITKLNGTMKDTKISFPRNQIFVVLNTNASIKLNAVVLESK